MKDKETNNETVAEVVEYVRSMYSDEPIYVGPNGYEADDFTEVADRIEEAHDREIKALEWKIENFAKVVECKDREIKAKDAKIAELLDCLKDACRFHFEKRYLKVIEGSDNEVE